MSRTAPDAETHLVGGDGIAWREIDGEIVVLDVRGSIYFGLNGSGAQLWKMLTAGADRADLRSALQTGADVSNARAAADVDVFLAQLAGHGLLRTA